MFVLLIVFSLSHMLLVPLESEVDDLPTEPDPNGCGPLFNDTKCSHWYPIIGA